MQYRSKDRLPTRSRSRSPIEIITKLLRGLYMSPQSNDCVPQTEEWSWHSNRWWMRTITQYPDSTSPEISQWYTKWIQYDEQGTMTSYTWYSWKEWKA